MQRSTALAQAAGVTPSDLPVRALGLVSGMFYTNRLDQIGLFLPRYLYGRHYKKSAFAPYVSPEHPDIVTSLPPSLLITSDNDNLHIIEIVKIAKKTAKIQKKAAGRRNKDHD
ncbi:esterase / lipase [human gut metagenome]|uniref:Esterase / lipase n=1 Tax=human gut metagenome TaxID=408170 RepID=K1R301_9ZZZZ